MNVLECHNVTKSFDNKLALENVSFSLEEGKCIALVGKNGAGKSTLLNLISNKLPLSSGEILNTFSESEIGYLTQTTKFPSDIKVAELLEFVASFSRNHLNDDEINYILNFTSTQLNQIASKLSGGQQRLLDVCLTIMNHPKFLIIDEPTAGMDTNTRQHFWKIIKNLKKKGTTIIFTTHYIEEIDYCADYVLLLKKGHLIANDTPFHLRSLKQQRTLIFDKKIYQQYEEKLKKIANTKEIVSTKQDTTTTWNFSSNYTNTILSSLLDQNINLSSVELSNASLLTAIFED